MYHEALDEVNKIKSEYEGKLIIANDNYCNAKAENETLKEKVDILFKLGRSYIENNKVKETQNERKENIENDDKTDPDVIEVDENFDDLQTWSKNIMRGFKRVDPTTKPTKQKQANLPKNPNVSPTPPPPREPQPPPARDSPGPPSRPTPETLSASAPTSPRKYCHYFVNYGKCNYEERSGEKCKFDHSQAPMCNLGINCSRLKCMFSHPRNTGSFSNSENGNFLGQGRNLSPWMNPWPMMNPWMTQPQKQSQFINPWNTSYYRQENKGERQQ